MARQRKRWSTWKIVVAAVGCAVLAGVLFWLSALMERTLGEPSGGPSAQPSVVTIPSFIMILAVTAVILSVLGLVWLVLRIRDARIPVWEKRGKKKRR